jgi:peptide/nickel transport system substrate-binding protein
MRRRDFLKRTAAAAGTAATAGYVFPARAQSHKDTLLTLSEGGPNNLDVMGVGTNRPGYEASWNTYDRLVTYGVKKDENGNDHYDHNGRAAHRVSSPLVDSLICMHSRRR